MEADEISSDYRVGIDSYGHITSNIKAGYSVDILGWGDLSGNVETEKDYISIQVAGAIGNNGTATIRSGADVQVEAWGDINARISAQRPADPPPKLVDHHYTVAVKTHGNFEGEVLSEHDVYLNAHGDVGGKVEAQEGLANVLAGKDVRTLEVRAQKDVNVTAWGSVQGDLTIKPVHSGGGGEVFVTIGNHAKVKVQDAENNVAIVAGGNVDADVVVVTGGKNVDIFADSAVNKASVEAPDGSVTIYAGGKGSAPSANVVRDIQVGQHPPSANPKLPRSVSVSTLGSLGGAKIKAQGSIEVFGTGGVTNLLAETTLADSVISVTSQEAVAGTVTSGNEVRIGGKTVKGRYTAGNVAGAPEGSATIVGFDGVDVTVEATGDVLIASGGARTAESSGSTAGDLNAAAHKIA